MEVGLGVSDDDLQANLYYMQGSIGSGACHGTRARYWIVLAAEGDQLYISMTCKHVTVTPALKEVNEKQGRNHHRKCCAANHHHACAKAPPELGHLDAETCSLISFA